MNRALYEKINKKSKYNSILNPAKNNEQEIFSTIRKQPKGFSNDLGRARRDN